MDSVLDSVEVSASKSSSDEELLQEESLLDESLLEESHEESWCFLKLQMCEFLQEQPLLSRSSTFWPISAA